MKKRVSAWSRQRIDAKSRAAPCRSVTALIPPRVKLRRNEIHKIISKLHKVSESANQSAALSLLFYQVVLFNYFAPFAISSGTIRPAKAFQFINPRAISLLPVSGL